MTPTWAPTHASMRACLNTYDDLDGTPHTLTGSSLPASSLLVRRHIVIRSLSTKEGSALVSHGKGYWTLECCRALKKQVSLWMVLAPELLTLLVDVGKGGLGKRQ